MILFSLQESTFFLSSHHFFVAIAVNTQTALRQLLQILPLPPFSSPSNAATQMPAGWLVVVVPEVTFLLLLLPFSVAVAVTA